MIPSHPHAPGRSEWVVGPVQVGAHRLEMKQISLGDAMAADVEGVVQPWWAHVWPAGRLLAEHILQGPRLDGRQCLDLGTGSGIVGIALGLMGARVTFADNSEESLSLARENAERAGLRGYELLQFDWNEPAPRQFDEVWAGDVVYEGPQVGPLARAIYSLIAPGGSALLSDPHRPPFQRFLAALEEHGLTWAVEAAYGEVELLRLRHAR